MWKYVQATGDFFQDGTYVETGYSGKVPDGKNRPDMECVVNVGPIPRGSYSIGAVRSNPTVLTLPLTASDPNYCNPPRSGFLIHGGNSSGTSSTGCIILTKQTRQRIADSGDKDVTVVRDSVLSARVKRRRYALPGADRPTTEVPEDLRIRRRK